MKTTATQNLVLQFVKSDASDWSSFCHARGLGVHGSTPEAQKVRAPLASTYAALRTGGTHMASATHFDWNGIDFFGVKLGRIKLFSERVVAFQVFNREMNDGSIGGLSILQVGRRHLFYVGRQNGRAKLCMGFLWVTEPQ